MKKGYAEVKEWFINKQSEKATRYNCFIDIYSRDENGKVEPVDGSYKGWKTWIPKSVIK